MTLLMLLTGRWFIGVLQLLVLAYNVREVKLQKHYVDVTEVFRDLPRQQTVRNIKLALYIFIFFIVVYRSVGHTLCLSTCGSRCKLLVCSSIEASSIFAVAWGLQEPCMPRKA